MSERKPPATGSAPERAPSGLERWVEDRRSFLKLAGFSFAAALLPGCGGEERYDAIPFLEKPEEITPGRAFQLATLCRACDAGCGLLTRSLDGRPVKLEGNPQHPLSRGRTCAAGQAAVLGLYDSQRLSGPTDGGAPATWKAVDAEIRRLLAQARDGGRAVRVLTGTVNGPSETHAIAAFLAGFQDAEHVQYDPLSCSALLDAHEALFGARDLPRVHLEHAEVIVSFDADFLSTGYSPVEHTRGYVDSRRLETREAPFSFHLQLESRLSLTGSNADRRIALRPDQVGMSVQALAAAVAAEAGVETPWKHAQPDVTPTIADAAVRLWHAPRGRTLVLAGTNDVAVQSVVAWINHLLGNYRLEADGASDVAADERTLDLVRPSYQKRGSDRAARRLLEDVQAGRVGALFVRGVNPVYDLPGGGEALAEALGKIPLVVSFAERIDETAAAARFVCPDHHALESWGDAEPVQGLLTLSQPTVRPLGDTRAFVESLARFGGDDSTAYAIMQSTWRRVVQPRANVTGGFGAFWERSLHDGFVDLGAPVASRTFDEKPLRALAPPPSTAEGLQVVLHAQAGMLDGRHAHNPWLQELPDPVTKVTWHNCACLAPTTADALGVEDGDVLAITAGSARIEVPALVQEGPPDGVVAVALGYGRLGTERFADIGPQWIEGRPTVEPGGLVGANAAPLLAWGNAGLVYARSRIEVKPTGRHVDLARSQIYGSLDVPARLAPPDQRRRDLVRQTTIDAWRKDRTSGNHPPHAFKELWADDHPYEGHHWGLAMDLNACTGCSACVVACQAENNVPVVGKDEVRRQRDMHWIRVDRYQQMDGDDFDVRFQPMMCQQCDNAPCETVCPVLATVHSSEGLNQQVYNRCVGTRYCANNCPYKVRRFNWFDYEHADARENLVLNPAVTVRSRGVMEKCTFCVQRIAEAKAEAKRQGQPLAEGAVQPACMQACPADAIVFGDTNDPESRVVEKLQDPRAYRVLGELNVRPSVGYLTRVRNRDAQAEGGAHG